MGKFPARPALAPLDDGIHWELLNRFYYDDDILGIITVPVGFITDGGSIPQLFQNIISPTGKGLKAFIIHDWLYAIQTCSKDDADNVLLRALRDCNFNHIGDDLIYRAVQDGAQEAWNEDSKNVTSARALGGLI